MYLTEQSGPVRVHYKDSALSQHFLTLGLFKEIAVLADRVDDLFYRYVVRYLSAILWA